MYIIFQLVDFNTNLIKIFFLSVFLEGEGYLNKFQWTFIPFQSPNFGAFSTADLYLCVLCCYCHTELDHILLQVNNSIICLFSQKTAYIWIYSTCSNIFSLYSLLTQIERIFIQSIGVSLYDGELPHSFANRCSFTTFSAWIYSSS